MGREFGGCRTGGRGELQHEGLATLQEVASDLYRTLGVARHATNAGIRKAYLQKARRFHPDLHPDDPDAEDRMIALNVAYDTLSDPTRRARYDLQKVQVSLNLPTEPAIQVSTIDWSPARAVALHYRGQQDPGVFYIATALIRRLLQRITR